MTVRDVTESFRKNEIDTYQFFVKLKSIYSKQMRGREVGKHFKSVEHSVSKLESTYQNATLRTQKPKKNGARNFA